MSRSTSRFRRRGAERPLPGQGATGQDADRTPAADPPLFTWTQLALILVLAVLAAVGLVLALERGASLRTAPAPTPTAAADVPFGSRPASKAVTCNRGFGMTISGHTFRDIRDDTPAISILGCTNVVIEDNDFIGDAEPIYVQGSTNVIIRRNRYQNITGPHERNGSHRGNFTQWDNSFGGQIVDNTGIGGDTEDVISIYQSGGEDAAHPLLIARNHFEGTNWTSVSGSGILLGDGGGSHVVVRDNVLLNVGQVGIGIAGGSDIHVLHNTVYGERRAGSNVGIYAWGQGASCSALEITGNRVWFEKANGTQSPIYDAGNCGTIAGLGANRFGSPLAEESLRVHL